MSFIFKYPKYILLVLVCSFLIGYKFGNFLYIEDNVSSCDEIDIVATVPMPPKMNRNSVVCPQVKVNNDGNHRCPVEIQEHLEFKFNTEDSVVYQIFGELHHPDTIKNLKAETILTHSDTKYESLSDCNEIYLTRSGSRPNMPNKCVAVVSVDKEVVSPVKISHRIGLSAGLTNRYAQDMHADHTDKHEMPAAFIKDRKKLIKMFADIMGNPIDSKTGERRSAIVMLANAGMIDLIINFICSTRSANIKLSDVIVFVGDQQSADIIEHLGLKYFMHPSAGAMPAKAAGFYGDNTFTYMMWLKVTSVYIAVAAGFDVLFQDADLIWVMDPMKYLKSLNEDAVFMDDGARSPRFAPLFANSGFYFIRSNEKIIYFQELMLKAYWEIEASHSHQSSLIHHLIEAHHLFGISVKILDEELFPSGIMFHHSKKYISDLQAHVKIPYVFHMCWTENRKQKVEFFKQLGWWFLPTKSFEDERLCSSPKEMELYFKDHSSKLLLEKCCGIGDYWKS